MRYLVVLFCVFCITSLSLGQKYSSKYDDIDIDEILSSQRVLSNYIKCILGEGPCTPEGREFKQHIPEAITDNCAKCNEAQVKIVRKTATYIMENRPEDWNKIKTKFDPQGKYADSFAKFLAGK